jgi:hypothetical protein
MKLNNIHLDLPVKNVVNHLDDLRTSSHKMEEVEKLVDEEEWKIKYDNIDYYLSFMSLVGMVTTSITMVIFCYCCCCGKCCADTLQVFQGGGRIITLVLPLY